MTLKCSGNEEAASQLVVLEQAWQRELESMHCCHEVSLITPAITNRISAVCRVEIPLVCSKQWQPLNSSTFLNQSSEHRLVCMNHNASWCSLQLSRQNDALSLVQKCTQCRLCTHSGRFQTRSGCPSWSCGYQYHHLSRCGVLFSSMVPPSWFQRTISNHGIQPLRCITLSCFVHACLEKPHEVEQAKLIPGNLRDRFFTQTRMEVNGGQKKTVPTMFLYCEI